MLDLEENRIEIKSLEEKFFALAHKEETKKFWLNEIKQYTSDVVALQEHLLDDLKIDPKQHIDTNEPTFKLPQRIEAYETNQNIKPSDFAENYTISKYSTTKATEEIKPKTVVTSATESAVHPNQKSHYWENVDVKAQKSSNIQSKIPILTKSTEEKHEQIETDKAEVHIKRETSEKDLQPAVKIIKEPKFEEKVQESSPPQNGRENPKVLVELKTEIVRKAPVDLQSVAVPPLKSQAVEFEEANKNFVEPIEAPELAKSELHDVEASVSEKLNKLSQKLRSIRKTETDKDIAKLPEAKKLSDFERTEDQKRKQEAIRESIQEKLEEDYISESSVIRRIEERYNRNYKDKDIKSLTKRKPSKDLDNIPKASEYQPENKFESEDQLQSIEPAKEEITGDIKLQKPLLLILKASNDEKLVNKEIKITKAADSNNSEQTRQPADQSQSDRKDSNKPESDRGSSNQGSSNNQSNQSGSSRKSDREPSPPSPGAIRLPGFFDPPPPTQYETSVEIHVRKEKYPDPPPKITRKVVVKNEELERKTEEFLRGETPYEKEDYSLGAAQKKIKNLKHNLGKTGENIKFAEDTYSKARVGDFKNIKTPGTVVAERKKEPVFEYQYTVEDPKTGLCITTSEPVDFEDAEEELTKLAKMDAEQQNKITKRVEGKIYLEYLFSLKEIISSFRNYLINQWFLKSISRRLKS